VWTKKEVMTGRLGEGTSVKQRKGCQKRSRGSNRKTEENRKDLNVYKKKGAGRVFEREGRGASPGNDGIKGWKRK